MNTRNKQKEVSGKSSLAQVNLKLHAQFFLFVIIFLFGSFLFSAASAHAATLYWVGTDGANTNVASNWKTTDPAGCGSGDASAAPGSTDVATFDADCDSGAAINATFNVSGMVLSSGYIGTVTQNTGIAITVGTGNFNQADGTFTGGDSGITINGNFTQSAGAFTSTSGTLTLSSTTTPTFTISGGTFTHNSGTVSWTGVNLTVDVNTTLTLNNLTLNGNSNTRVFTISSADTLVVNGTLTLTNAAIATSGGSNIDAKGAISVASTFDGGSGLVVIDGVGAQSFTVPDGAILPGITLNQASTTIDFAAAANVTIKGALTLTSGTFTSTSGTLTLSSSGLAITHTIGASATFNANSGTISWTGGDNMTFDVNSSLTLNNLTLNGSVGNKAFTVASADTLVVNGTLTLTNATIATSGGSNIDAKGAISVASTFDGGSGLVVIDGVGAQSFTVPDGAILPGITLNQASTTIDFAAAANVTMAGAFTLQSGTFTSTSGTLTLSLAGGGAVLTISGGTFNHNNGTVAFTGANSTLDVNTSLTLYNLTRNGSNTLTLASADTVVITNTLTLTNGAIASTSGAVWQAQGDVTIASTFDGGNGILTFAGTATQTYTDNAGIVPTGAVTVNKASGAVNLATNMTLNTAGQDLAITSGTLDLSGHNLTVNDQFTVAAAGILQLQGGETITGGPDTLSAGSTVIYNGTSTYTSLPAGNTYSKLTFNGSGGTWKPNGTLTVSSALTITLGTLDINGQNLTTTSATFSNNGTLQLQGGETLTGFTNDTDSGTVTYNGTSTYTGLKAGNSYYNLTFNGIGGTWTLNAGLAVSNVLTITAGTLSADAQTITLSGTTGTPFTNAGTFTATTSTVSYTGNNSGGDTTVANVTYYNLTVNNASETYVLAATTTVNNNLTITAGTLDAVSGQNYGLTVGATWSNSGTFTPRLGTLTLTGTSTFSDTTSFYNLTINGSTKTVTLGAALTATNNLTITAGTLDVSAAGCSAASCAVSVGGNFSNAGTFTARSGTVTLTSTSASATLTSGGSSFYNLTQNGSGGTYTLQDALSATNNLTITAGTLDTKSASNFGITVGGNFSNAGTFTARLGTVTFNGSSTQTVTSGGTSFYGLTHSGSGTLQLVDAAVISNALTNSAGIFDINAQALTTTSATISNTATIQAQGGETITGFTNDTDSGTVTYVGTSTYASLNLGNSYYALIFNGVGGSWTHTSTLDVNGNLTITAGTLISGGQNITLAGNWSNAGSYTSGLNTVTFDGAIGTQTLISGGTGTAQDFNNVQKSGGGTLQFSTNGVDIDGTLTIDSSTTVDLNGQNISSVTTLINNGTFQLQGGETVGITTKDTDSGTVLYNGTGSYTTALAYGNTYYHLTFNGSGGVWEPSAAVTVNGNLTLTSGTFDIDGQNLTVTGTFSNNATLRLTGDETTVSLTMDTDSGTISYDGSSSYTGFKLGNTYYHLVLNGTGTWTLNGALTTGGNLTVTAGTVDFNGYNPTVAGDFTNSGTLLNTSLRTVTLNGTTQTFSPGSTTFSTLAITGSSGTVSLTSGLTLVDLLSIVVGRVLSIISSTLTASSATITNNGTISFSSGNLIHASSGFYLANSTSYDIATAFSLGVDTSVYATITDTSAQLNGTSQDTVSITVTCPNDSETLTLTETTNTSGIFRSATPLTLGTYSGSAVNNNGTLLCVDGNTITASYTDAHDGTDTNSATALATIDTVPTTPSSFAGSAASSTSITWTWTDNANNETGFKLYSGTGTLITTIATANTTSYTETGLTKGVSYTRKIVTYNNAGNSSFSNSASVTTPAEPTAPSSFAGSAASSTSITWTWTDNSSDETGFKLLDSSGNLLVTIATANTTSYTETGLSASTSYTRKIAAYNSDGTSAASNTAAVSTSTSLPPTAPVLTGPATDTLTSSSLPSFSFKKSTDPDDSIASYTLVVGSLSFTSIPASAASASNPLSGTHRTDRYIAQYFNENDGNDTNDTITVTLLSGASSDLPLPDDSYSWHVTAIDSSANATSSGSRTLTVDATKPTIGAPTISGATVKDAAYTTLNTKPTIAVTLSDAHALSQVLVSLQRPNTILGVTTSYTTIQSSTYSLSGTEEGISFIPKNALLAGLTYRVTFLLTDEAGNQTTKTITLSVLSEQQQAQQAVQDLNADTNSSEQIVETLRNALPQAPLNIPSLQEKALLRYQKQAENFQIFANSFNALFAYIFNGQGAFERSLAALLHALGNGTNQLIAFMTDAARLFTRVALAFGQRAMVAGAQAGNDIFANVISTVTAGRGLLAQHVERFALAAGTLSQNVFAVDVFKPLTIAAKGIAMSTPNKAATISAQQQIAFGLKNIQQSSQRLYKGARQVGLSARDTRIKVGLANRQAISKELISWFGPVKRTSDFLALKGRATYELWFDRTPTYITNVQIASISPTSALVEWDTNHVTHLTKVNYGTSKSYGQEIISTESDTHHSINLPNLKPETTYYFEVMNQNGNYVFDAYYALTTPKDETITTPLVPQQAVIQGIEPVNVYKDANPTAEIITTVKPGETYRALLQLDGWIAILLPSGDQGWVAQDSVTLHDQTSISPSSRTATPAF